MKSAGHIANHLNVHFTEIGYRLASNLPVPTTNAEDYLKREPSSFEFAEIESSRVLKLLSKLDVTKATGLDQISNKVLKLAAPVIYKQLTELFNLSLKSGIIYTVNLYDSFMLYIDVNFYIYFNT